MREVGFDRHTKCLWKESSMWSPKESSICLSVSVVAGQKRCFCSNKFQWNSINGTCDSE
ncbi:hypothetical protein BVRB_6g141030 [Beta vulgaris subsp. vulgaris]|nr:hypothetical protein BVRB_6g141030 [Beta vulgaris subsp. vulgaris]